MKVNSLMHFINMITIVLIRALAVSGVLLFYSMLCNKILICENIILTIVIPNNDFLSYTISVHSSV